MIEHLSDAFLQTLESHVPNQEVIKYPLKCLAHLRNSFRDLAPSDRQILTPLLEKTGCLQALTQ